MEAKQINTSVEVICNKRSLYIFVPDEKNKKNRKRVLYSTIQILSMNTKIMKWKLFQIMARFKSIYRQACLEKLWIIIKNFVGKTDDLKNLGKLLKA